MGYTKKNVTSQPVGLSSNKKGIINVGGPSQTVFKFASKDNKKIKKIFSKGEFPKRTDMNLRKLKTYLKNDY